MEPSDAIEELNRRIEAAGGDTALVRRLRVLRMAIERRRGRVEMAPDHEVFELGEVTLQSGAILPDGNQVLSPDTLGQIDDLMVEFWKDTSITAEDAQARYADIIARAD